MVPLSICTSHFSSIPSQGVLGTKLMDQDRFRDVLRHFIGNVNYLAWPDPSLAKDSSITFVHNVHND